MKRPIFVAVIGYIIGIIVGLYFKISIVSFYIPVIAIYVLYKKLNNKKLGRVKLFSLKRYLRYVKIYLNSKLLILLIISSIISNMILICKNRGYDEIYESFSKKENIQIVGVIISKKEEKQYYYKYKLETKYNNKKIRFYITTSKDILLDYGDEISILGVYVKPEIQRNYKGFNYSQYLKQLKVYGTIKCDRLNVLSKNKSNMMFKISNDISDIIIKNTKEILEHETSSVLLGLILGYKIDISEDIREDFSNASMSHILAVSGMHVSYIILGISIIFNGIIGKRKTYILNIIILVFYMFITNFSPSITRAGIMSIIMIFSKVIHRKSDIYTSMSISAFLILIYNPFIIQNLGFQLSFIGTIGIIVLNKSILKLFKDIKIKNKFYKYKVKPKIYKPLEKIKEILSVSISVQIFIFPIILSNLNTFNPYFLISNLLLSFCIGPIVIFSFVFIILILINVQFANLFSYITYFLIKFLVYISKIGKIPFSKIYISTPSLFSIIIYYLFFTVLLFVYSVKSSKNPNMTQIRVRNLIALLKLKLRRSVKKIIVFLIMFIFVTLIISIYSRRLYIFFIDVGQGDSTLIVTPRNKTILIDGGGSVNSDFDVGRNTLIPYILDRGCTSIDVIIVSHFDNDHIDGIISLIEELDVGKVYISKQIENSKNYERFLKTTKQKNTKICEVVAGDRIHIEKNIFFDVLWPYKKQITTNALNNNSIVCNLHYNHFSMLFTGDMEEIAEKEILDLYSGAISVLRADILKVAHHGSKSSTSLEFLKIVSPRVAVIGVGKDNKFGHPNDGILERLNGVGCSVYRTDLNGEIMIEVDSKSRFRLKVKIKSD